MARDSFVKPDFSDLRGRSVLIALSGGADSVALATLLAEGRKAFDLTLYALHVDHGIRPDSAEDAEYCRALCAELGIPFECVRIDVPAEARRNHAGLEAEARRLRYACLRSAKRRTGADCIALAHHMDDQAETVLMHLGRGAGPEGIGAMRRFSGDLYRPLLGCRKAELVDFLTRRGIAWREDSTNRVDDNPRNAIRLHAIPELEKCYPQFVRSAARYALTAQIESDCLDALAREYLSKAASGGAFCAWLELASPPHPAVLRRAIRARCPEALDWEQVNALEALCGQARGKIDLGRNYYAERAGCRLYFVPKRPPAIAPVSLSMNGISRLPGLCAVSAVPCEPVPIRDDPARQVLNPRALEGAVLRTRRPGDRIRPLGCGDRLLSDYLIDKKVDRPLRDALPLVAVGDRVHWACGLGISQEAAIEDGDSAVLLEYRYETTDYNGGKRYEK